MMKHNWKITLVTGATLAALVGAMVVPSLATVGRKTAYLDYQNMKVTLNGQELQLRDSLGNLVEPFTIDGTTYLPLAAISKALGINVAWDDSTKTVILTTNDASSQTGTTTGTTTGTPLIGEAKAKELALNHAGLSSSQVTFYIAKLDWENGRQVYDVEFWSGNKEYDYEIDAITGDIVGFDQDIEGYVPPTSTTQTDIGSEKAKSIALNHAGVSAANAVFLYVQPDYENGRKVYEVEFYNGNKEYDYEIDAATGDVLSYDFDAEYYTPTQNNSSYIGEAKAKALVEQKAGTTGTFREFKLDWDDGRAVYEGKLISGWMEYEFEIDATTGTFLDWDIDWD